VEIRDISRLNLRPWPTLLRAATENRFFQELVASYLRGLSFVARVLHTF
jgi:hypothetical protein